MDRPAVPLDAYAQARWAEVYGASARLRALPGLARDVWAAYFMPLVQVDPAAGPPGAEVIRHLLASPAYQEIRPETELDDWLSALATAEFVEQMATAGAVEAAPGAGAPGAPPLAEAVSAAARAVAEKVAAVRAALQGCGIARGSLRRLPMARQMEMAEALRRARHLRGLAERAGRFRELASQSLRQAAAGHAPELVGVALGSDLVRALPAELGLLSHPAGRLEFARRWSEGRILQYAQAPRPPGQGPLVLLIDCSGSTEPIQDWLKGAALALIGMARTQNRRCAVLFFAADPADLHTVEFAPGERSPEKLVDVATWFTGGGTAWRAPVDAARQVLQTHGFRHGDILLITDGECNDFLHAPAWVERFNAERRRAGYRCIGVLVNTPDPEDPTRPHPAAVERIRPAVDEVRFLNTAADTPEGLFRLVTEGRPGGVTGPGPGGATGPGPGGGTAGRPGTVSPGPPAGPA